MIWQVSALDVNTDTQLWGHAGTTADSRIMGGIKHQTRTATVDQQQTD